MIDDKIWHNIKIIGMGVNGILNDGNIYFSLKGEELCRFCRADDFGLKMLMQNDFIVLALSANKSAITRKYLEQLRIPEIHLGITEKINILQQVAAKYDCGLCDIAYIGVDMYDLEIFNHIGLPIAVADAQPEILEAARYITKKAGGNGAVREVCNLIIEAKLRNDIAKADRNNDLKSD